MSVVHIHHVYTKKRSEFGCGLKFDYSPSINVTSIPTDPNMKHVLLNKPYVNCSTQNSPNISEHEVMTDGQIKENSSVEHVEGGWPKEVNRLDSEQVTRYRKRIERDEIYTNSVNNIAENTENFILQNNAINIYSMYFPEYGQQPKGTPNISTFGTLKVPGYPTEKDCVSAMDIGPLNKTRLVSAYSPMTFIAALNSCVPSYVWNIGTLSCEAVLNTYSSLVSVKFNPGDPFCVLGGCLNGQVAIWDIRKGKYPVLESKHSGSHYDAVWSTIWIQSKGNTDFFSGGNGEVKWWDTRRVEEPYETLLMDLSGNNDRTNAEGIYCLGYDNSLPTKFLAGTEAGQIILCDKKDKTPANAFVIDCNMGPVYMLQRNSHFPKSILATNGWKASIWADDAKEDSLFSTPMRKTHVSAVCWSPIRPAVFYTCSLDGVLEIWDIYYRHDVPVISVKLTNGEAIRSILALDDGMTLLTGDDGGIIRLIKTSSGLIKTSRAEKQYISALFEAERRRMKLLEKGSKRKISIHSQSSDRKTPGTDVESSRSQSVRSSRSLPRDISPQLKAVEVSFTDYIKEQKAIMDKARAKFEENHGQDNDDEQLLTNTSSIMTVPRE